jgi:hypothetical protein
MNPLEPISLRCQPAHHHQTSSRRQRNNGRLATRYNKLITPVIHKIINTHVLTRLEPDTIPSILYMTRKSNTKSLLLPQHDPNPTSLHNTTYHSPSCLDSREPSWRHLIRQYTFMRVKSV